MFKKLRQSRDDSIPEASSSSGSSGDGSNKLVRTYTLPLRSVSIVSMASTNSAPAATGGINLPYPTALESSDEETRKPTRTAEPFSFFALPGEIRNEIYTYVALNTSLSLASSIVGQTSTRRPSMGPLRRKTGSSSRGSFSGPNDLPPPPPAFLLASKQTRHEFLPFLLSLAPLRAPVSKFDFRNLVRVMGSLYATERRALRENRNLTILLLPPGMGTSEVLAGLRRWLSFCSTAGSGAGSLPWRYVVDFGDGGGRTTLMSAGEKRDDYAIPGSRRAEEKMGKRKCLRKIDIETRKTLLIRTLAGLSVLYRKVEESLKFEIAPIVDSLERALEELRDVVPLEEMDLGSIAEPADPEDLERARARALEIERMRAR